MEFMKYNFMGNKADENVPDQDLSNTTGSSLMMLKLKLRSLILRIILLLFTLTTLQLILNKVVIMALL